MMAFAAMPRTHTAMQLVMPQPPQHTNCVGEGVAFVAQTSAPEARDLITFHAWTAACCEVFWVDTPSCIT